MSKPILKWAGRKDYLATYIDKHISDLENKNLLNKNFNLIGWQTVDIYQNLSITYISSIIKNQKFEKNLFKLPKQN